MVQHSQTKRGRDIKTKLMAAIAMLLVASIMMVSTTYAWFTLSTAPEVTGITTSVGANGNLEMALLPSGNESGVFADAGTAIDAIGNASGGETVVQSNVTWGNLVNLSDESYGFGKIVLYPSTLNASNGSLVSGALLNIPTYGNDGRVSGLKQVGMTGIYDGSAFYSGGYGVRAVGSASGMTALELAFRNHVAAGNSAANNANKSASTALGDSGTRLVTMGMDRKLNNKNEYEDADVQAVLSIFQNLKSGALTYIDTALRNYVAAAYLTTVNAEHTGTDPVVTLILDTTKSWSDILATTVGDSNLGDLLPTQLKTAIDDFIVLVNDVDASITALTKLIDTEDTHLWTSFSTHAAKLVDADTMLIEGKDLEYWTETDASGKYANIEELANKAFSGQGLAMKTSGGLFAQVAKFCGTITASMTIENISYGGFTASIPATMTAEGTGAAHLSTLKAAVGALSVQGGSGANLPISDYYGYAIDLAFRTNAAGSKLKLQGMGIDRVYSENEANDATMGHGATMTFNTTNVDNYAPANILNLMECYRVVFYDPETMVIYGYARLDPTTEYIDDAGNYTMTLRMYDEENKAWAADDVITDLPQNEAKAVSVFVYIDGATITNSDVATANLSGKMNLQFSSSATLTPMEYADLRNGSGAAAATKYSVTLPEAGITGAAAEAEAGKDYTFTVADGYTLDAVTVSDVPVSVNPDENGLCTIPAVAVTGAIKITVTANNG